MPLQLHPTTSPPTSAVLATPTLVHTTLPHPPTYMLCLCLTPWGPKWCTSSVQCQRMGQGPARGGRPPVCSETGDRCRGKRAPEATGQAAGTPHKQREGLWCAAARPAHLQLHQCVHATPNCPLPSAVRTLALPTTCSPICCRSWNGHRSFPKQPAPAHMTDDHQLPD
jgi:hypothetical protein